MEDTSNNETEDEDIFIYLSDAKFTADDLEFWLDSHQEIEQIHLGNRQTAVFQKVTTKDVSKCRDIGASKSIISQTCLDYYTVLIKYTCALVCAFHLPVAVK